MNLSQDELCAPNAGVDLVRGTANGVSVEFVVSRAVGSGEQGCVVRAVYGNLLSQLKNNCHSEVIGRKDKQSKFYILYKHNIIRSVR